MLRMKVIFDSLKNVLFYSRVIRNYMRNGECALCGIVKLKTGEFYAGAQVCGFLRKNYVFRAPIKNFFDLKVYLNYFKQSDPDALFL